MSFTIRICIGLIAIMATSTRASTQSMQLQYEATAQRLDWPEDGPVNFWQHFELAFAQRAEKTFTDRFHSLNATHWYFAQADLNADDFRESTGNTARRALTRSVATSFREATFELPVVEWLKERRSFLAELILYSMDNGGEDAVAPLDPSYRALERSWWKRLSDSRDFCFGLRPFRSSPYAFVSKAIRKGDTLLALAHVRYHYRDFADHQFELALSLPLAHGCSIDFGTAYQFGRHAETKRMVLKLAKQFATGGIVHIGVEAQEHPRFIVGLSLPL